MFTCLKKREGESKNFLKGYGGFSLCLLGGWLLSCQALAKTSPYALDPSKRICAEISKDSMNRIAMANDRITQVFGDRDAYEVEAEDTTGQIFIKPTVENGDKPLSLTVITEKNVTQDLLLMPQEREATTVILKNPQAPMALEGEGAFPLMNSGGFPPLGHSMMRAWHPGDMMLSYGDALVEAMRKLISHALPTLEMEVEPSRKTWGGLQVSFEGAYPLGALKGYIFKIRNGGETAIEIQEEHGQSHQRQRQSPRCYHHEKSHRGSCENSEKENKEVCR